MHKLHRLKDANLINSTFRLRQRGSDGEVLDWLNIEFSKSRAMRASMVYVPTRPRANVPKVHQFLIFTCQRAKEPQFP